MSPPVQEAELQSTAVTEDERYARVLSLLESIDRRLADLCSVWEKYKPMLERLEKRLQPKWGASRAGRNSGQ